MVGGNVHIIQKENLCDRFVHVGIVYVHSPFIYRMVSNMNRTLLNILLFPLGCFGGGAPTPPPMPAPAPQQAQGNVVAAQQAAMQRQRAAASNTNLTGGMTMMPKLQGKSLLGT
jgi:hypothetical protein